MPRPARLRERGGELVERLDVGSRGDVAQRGVQIGAGAVGGDGAPDLAGEQVATRGRQMERVGDVRDRVLEAVLRGERPDEREEVRQLAGDLGLAALRPGGEVLGREHVAHEGEREGEQQRSSEQRGEGDPEAEDRGGEHELGGVHLGRGEDLRVEPGADDVALAHLGRERRRPRREAHRDRCEDPLPERLVGGHESLVPVARDRDGADRVEASRGEQRAAEDRHAQAEHGEGGGDGPDELHRPTPRAA